MIQITRAQLEAIRLHGVKAFPRECVGVLLGDMSGDVKTVREVRPIDNTFEPSEEFEHSVMEQQEVQNVQQVVEKVGQERRYLISPDTMFALMQEERRTKRRVLGFYHSHPDHPARPSVYDLGWAWPLYTYIIVSILDGKPDALTAWQLMNDRAAFKSEAIEEIEENRQD